MTHKYKYKFPKTVYAIFILFICLFLTFSIFNLLRLLKVNDMFSINPAMDIFSLIFSLFTLLLMLLVIFNSSYKLKNTFTCVFGFIIKKINYENILLIQYQEKSKILILFYLAPPDFSYEHVQYLRINIDEKHMDDFVASIRKHNHSIKYEILKEQNETNHYSEQ